VDDDRNEPRLKTTSNIAKKKSPPPLMLARKASPSISHSNNIQSHSLAKKPRLHERHSSNFRESPVSVLRESSSSGMRESTSPFRDSPINAVSFRDSVNNMLKDVSSASNHQVPSLQAVTNHSSSEETSSPAHSTLVPSGDSDSEKPNVKLETQEYSDSKADSPGGPSRHGIDLLMESTMETSDEQYIVGEGAPPDEEYSHDQSDDGSIATYEDSSGVLGGPSTSQSFSEEFIWWFAIKFA